MMEMHYMKRTFIALVNAQKTISLNLTCNTIETTLLFVDG